MKYSIVIDQKGIYEAGLASKTDLIDWAIIDYLKSWYFIEHKKIFTTADNKEYIWLNYNHLLSEMPLLSERDEETKRLKKLDKNRLTERIKKLKDLGLIETITMKDNTLYFRLSELSCRICFSSQNENEFHTPYHENSDRAITEIVTGLSLKQGQHNNNTNNNNTLNNNIKEKENIYIKEKEKEESGGEKIQLGENVYMSEAEIKKLVEGYTLDVVVRAIAKLDNYLANKKKKYKNHYKVMHTWVLDSILKDLGIAKSKADFDRLRDEKYKRQKEENQEDSAERLREFVFDKILPYRIDENQVIYNRELFFERLKEILGG